MGSLSCHPTEIFVSIKVWRQNEREVRSTHNSKTGNNFPEIFLYSSTCYQFFLSLMIYIHMYIGFYTTHSDLLTEQVIKGVATEEARPKTSKCLENVIERIVAKFASIKMPAIPVNLQPPGKIGTKFLHLICLWHHFISVRHNLLLHDLATETNKLKSRNLVG